MEQKIKVLIADETEFGKTVGKALTAKGAEVSFCKKDGKEVLKVNDSFHPDVILSDIFMSGALSGYASLVIAVIGGVIVATIYAIRKNIASIFLTLALFIGSMIFVPAADMIFESVLQIHQKERILSFLGIINDPRQMGGYPEYKGEPRKDTDGDGMPDAWETANGLNPNDASDANGDLSGDGYTNIEKYINGIDPTKQVDWTNLENNHDTLAAIKGLF
jgi:hypothetical protein